MNATSELAPAQAPVSLRPPMWLIVATGVLAITCLALAVAETNLRAHYLIDQGEYISMFGLGFILVAGTYLYTRRTCFLRSRSCFPGCCIRSSPRAIRLSTT